MIEAPLSEHVRIHLDWWGQCRTCRHWSGDRWKGVAYGRCSNTGSPMCIPDREIDESGHCPKWDTFDMVAAEIVMRWDEEQKGRGQHTESPDMDLARRGL